ncbi:MAG: hypothetical protein NTZ53_14045 [Cyanobacteria bacterium]|nr:hypothetical protein [Cyanobacteriota bacterium]
MTPNRKVQLLRPWGWLVTALPMLGLLQPSSAQAFSLSPLRIEANRGQLQIGNSSDRTIRVQLQVFAPRQVNGIKTAGLEPLADEIADNLIQLRPSVFRLGPGATRVVPYRIVSTSQPFYVCGTSLQGLFNMRVCSRWAAAAPSSALAAPRP